MKGLLIKDLTLNKRELILALVICAVLGLVIIICGILFREQYVEFYEASGSVMLSVPFFCAPTLLFNLIQSEDKCGYLMQAFSSPAARKDYVKGKYAYSFIHMGLFLIISLIYVFIATAFSRNGLNSHDLISGLLKVTVGLVIQLFAVTLMIYYYIKYSLKEMGIALIVVFTVGIFALAFITGFAVGLSQGAENPFILKTYIAVMISVFVSTEIVLFIKSFRAAETKEF